MKLLRIAASLVMALLVTACIGSGHLAGADGRPKTVASALEPGMGRLVVIRDTDGNLGSSMAALEVSIDSQPAQTIRNKGVFVYDLPAGAGYRIGLTQPWWDKGPNNTIIGNSTPTLVEGKTLYFLVGYSKTDTLSGGTKALSVLLSGDSGARHSFYVSPLDEERAQDYLAKYLSNTR